MTHPFHPFHGQVLDVAFRRRHFAEDRVYFRDSRGAMASMPTAWTSAGPDPLEDALVVRASAFRVDDLIELVGLVARLRS